MSPSSSRASTLLRYYLPVLLWVALITVLSGSQFYGGLTYRWIQVIVRFFAPDVSPEVLGFINVVARKLAHVTEFFLLALLLWRALKREAEELWQRTWAGTTLAVGILVAGLDELHQVFEPRRGGELLDVGWDTLGLLLALALLYTRAHRQSAGAATQPPGR